MARSRYKIFETQYPYFITSTFVEGFPLLADPDVAKIMLDSLTFLQSQREATLLAYVLMENHFHLIAKSEDLASKIKNLKSYTARQIIDIFKLKKRTRFLTQLSKAKLPYKIESNFQVWQESFYPKQITDEETMMQKIEYIHNNPVKRGYVDQPEDWRYSSARNYAGAKALIPITLFGKRI